MKSAILFLALAASATTNAQPGALDPTFSSDGKLTLSITNLNAACEAVIVQPDGKIITAGWNGTPETQNDFALARFNPNGSLDSNFNETGKVLLDFNGANDICLAVALQSNGKILAAGYTDGSTGFEFALARFESNGTPDETFGLHGQVTANVGVMGFCHAVAVQPDGKIVVSGYALSPVTLGNEMIVLRFHQNGSPDTDFGTDGKATASFIHGSAIGNCMALQSDGKIVVAGQTVNDATLRWESALLRLNNDGTRDIGFGDNGEVITGSAGLDNNVKAVALQPDGKIVLAGFAGTSPSNNRFMLTRYLSDGALDPGFADNGILFSAAGPLDNQAHALEIGQGRIFAGGSLQQNGEGFFAVAAYHFDGTKDESFGVSGTAVAASGMFDGISALALQSDGKIVAAGSTVINNASRFALARFEAASVLGTAYNPINAGEISVFPNPLTANSKLRLNLDNAETLQVNLFNASGQHITNVIDGQFFHAGNHEMALHNFDGLPQGIYYLTIRTASRIATLKLVR